MDAVLEVAIALPLLALQLQQIGSLSRNERFPLPCFLVQGREICIGSHVEHIIAVLNDNDCGLSLWFFGSEGQRGDGRILDTNRDENNDKRDLNTLH